MPLAALVHHLDDGEAYPALGRLQAGGDVTLIADGEHLIWRLLNADPEATRVISLKRAVAALGTRRPGCVVVVREPVYDRDPAYHRYVSVCEASGDVYVVCGGGATGGADDAVILMCVRVPTNLTHT